jgi:hypothetical protein
VDEVSASLLEDPFSELDSDELELEGVGVTEQAGQEQLLSVLQPAKEQPPKKSPATNVKTMGVFFISFSFLFFR